MGFPDERLSADDEDDCLAMVQQQCRSFLKDRRDTSIWDIQVCWFTAADFNPPRRPAAAGSGGHHPFAASVIRLMKQIVPKLKPAAHNWSPDQIAQDLIDGKYDGTLSESFQLLSKKQLAEVIRAVAAIQHDKREQ